VSAPKPTRIDLKIVDENFTAAPTSSPEDRAKHQAAAGIREGKRRARVEFADAMTVAAAVIDEAKELRLRPTLAEEIKHGRFRFYQGIAAGIIAGSLLACVAIFTMQGVIWDTAARSFREQAMTGALLSTQAPE
jgi:hypothetical protein